MDSGGRHARDVLLCDRYAPCNPHRSMAVRPKGLFLPRKGDTSCARPRAEAPGRSPTHAGVIWTSGPAVITPPRAARYRLGVCVNLYHSNAQQLPVIYREQVRIGPKTRPRRMV